MLDRTKQRPQWLSRFERTVRRLLSEARQMRYDWAAICAARGEYSSNLFLQTAIGALQSDVMIRLIRVFENSDQASSFWYLHRCAPTRVAIDIPKLKEFSERLKKVRDAVFVHIDKSAVFDPQQIYVDAAINIAEDSDEIAFAIDALWTALTRLYREQEGRPVRDAETTFASLRLDFKRELKTLID